MADDRLPSSVQESLATAVALINDNNSSIIANLVEPTLFDSPLDNIVSRCQEHRRTLKKPPGKSHIDDVFAAILEDKNHKQNARYHSIINNMVRHADSINTEFLLGEVASFVRRRRGARHATPESRPARSSPANRPVPLRGYRDTRDQITDPDE